MDVIYRKGYVGMYTYVCTYMCPFFVPLFVAFPVMMMMEMASTKNRLSVPSHKPLLCYVAKKKQTNILTEENELEK
jgi:hypothetical protein